MAYATYADVEAGFRTLTVSEQIKATHLLDEAAVLIDAYAPNAEEDNKNVVSCRLVRRVLGDAETQSAPMGATQGTITAGGYSQSWTLSNGSAGEMYLGKTDKILLGIGAVGMIGASNPLGVIE